MSNRTIIIGGGVIGLSLAYHLARRGCRDVLVLERNQLTSGTSWHAAGIVGPLRATGAMTRLAMIANRQFPRLERETGLSTGYRRTGGYWLARRAERMDELHRIAALGRHFGMAPAIVPASDVAQALPAISPDGLVGAMHVPEDASVNPVDLCMAYAHAARTLGVEIREGAWVADISCENGRVGGVRLGDGATIAADRIALCAGAWSGTLAQGAGLMLPLQAVQHMYVVTEPDPAFEGFPVLRDLDTGIYIKGDAGKLVIGGFERDAVPWDPQGPEGNRPFLELAENWDQFEPFMTAALALIPALNSTGIRHFMNGPESFTHDTQPLIGPAPDVDGLYVAAGMNSVGVMSSAGVGQVLADWMEDDAPPFDLWQCDVARADPLACARDHLHTRMKEAVADQLAMHWPYKQPQAGRGLRRSSLHDCWAAEGAVFGVTAGWERPLWFAAQERERDLPYSVADQPWWPIAAREAGVMASGCTLLDLSPFTKISVSGPVAVAALDRLSTARLDTAEGRAIYTQLLNERGGIEMDVTVTRAGPARMEVTSGAPTRWRDLSWLRRNLPQTVAIKDETEDSAVIGVMGETALEILASLAADWPCPGFGQVVTLEIEGAPCRATRISFVGEPGCELRVANADAGAVFAALRGADARPMGHYALDGCRIEKGYRHWGHDIGPDVTPLEAGLGFTIDWDRDFTGKEALLAQKGQLKRRLHLLEIEGGPLTLHDEPVWEAGQVVGLTTSGARGARTGLTLALAMIENTGEALDNRRFEVEIAGRRYGARALHRAPFDPKGERMRA